MVLFISLNQTGQPTNSRAVSLSCLLLYLNRGQFWSINLIEKNQRGGLTACLEGKMAALADLRTCFSFIWTSKLRMTVTTSCPTARELQKLFKLNQLAVYQDQGHKFPKFSPNAGVGLGGLRTRLAFSKPLPPLPTTVRGAENQSEAC